MIDSWDLHLRAERKSAKIRTYLEAAQWLAAEYLIPAGLADWDHGHYGLSSWTAHLAMTAKDHELSGIWQPEGLEDA